MAIEKLVQLAFGWYWGSEAQFVLGDLTWSGHADHSEHMKGLIGKSVARVGNMAGL